MGDNTDGRSQSDNGDEDGYILNLRTINIRPHEDKSAAESYPTQHYSPDVSSEPALIEMHLCTLLNLGPLRRDCATLYGQLRTHCTTFAIWQLEIY